MSVESYCLRSPLRDTVLVKPHMIGSNYREVVLHLLRSFEGVCSRHGYIVPGSISVHKIDNGNVQAFSLNGDVCYNVRYYASVCNPPIGAVLNARIVNMNKFGIMTHSVITAEDGTFKPVIESIITRQPAGPTLGSDVDLDTLKIGDTVFVEILGKKFDLNDKKISVIGRVSAKEKLGKRKAAQAAAVSDVLVREDYEEDPEEIGTEFEDEDIGSEDEDAKKKKKRGDDDDEDEDEDGDEERGESEEDEEEEDDEDDDGDGDGGEGEGEDSEELSDGDDDDEDDDISTTTKKKTKIADNTGKKAEVLPPKKKLIVKGGGGSNAASEFFDDSFDVDGGSGEEFGGGDGDEDD